MSWIKDNKFVVSLIGGTLLGVILLYVVGYKAQVRYDAAKENYQAASTEVESYSRMKLYPTPENRNSKKKALDEYRENLESLQKSFDVYRPAEMKNVSTQDFTNHLKSVNDELRAAFDQSGTKVPEPFFCGFESYRSSIVNGNATGILEYQLDGIKQIMLALAKSRASELKNLHRPQLIEETGAAYAPQKKDVARPLPLEIVFEAPEKSVREFLSALNGLGDKFAVIRSIRISNTKKDAPRVTDAKFDTPLASSPDQSSSRAVDDLFAGGFVLPDEKPKTPVAGAAEGTTPVAEQPAPAPPPKTSDSGRVLSQVLGNEQLQVFIRLDFMLFLPAGKLP